MSAGLNWGRDKQKIPWYGYRANDKWHWFQKSHAIYESLEKGLESQTPLVGDCAMDTVLL